jgi:hypothetical protein
VSDKRTAWHYVFAILLHRYGPRRLDVRDEVALSKERPRVDYLLRKQPDAPADDTGRVLRGLWRHLALVTVAELKTLGRPYRKRDLDQLWSYLHAYLRAPDNGLERRSDLCGLLLVPGRTPSLDEDAGEMGLTWKDLGCGYWELSGGLFRLYVAAFDVVAEHGDGDLVSWLCRAKGHTLEARRFWAEMVGTTEARMAMNELEEYDELIRRALDQLTPEQRLEGLTLEQRLAGLPPEQRLAGLTPEQILSALPAEVVEELARKMRH